MARPLPSIVFCFIGGSKFPPFSLTHPHPLHPLHPLATILIPPPETTLNSNAIKSKLKRMREEQESRMDDPDKSGAFSESSPRLLF